MLHIRAGSFLWSFHDHPEIKRFKHQGRYVSFSADPNRYDIQLQNRLIISKAQELPSDFEAIQILVEKIKHPQLNLEALAKKLKTQNAQIEPEVIENLFLHHKRPLKKTTFEWIDCLLYYINKQMGSISSTLKFLTPPAIEVRPSFDKCPACDSTLKVLKTHWRMITTLHVGKLNICETVLVCPQCHCKYHSDQLCNLVPPGANFGYDVLICVGNALFIRHRNEEEVVNELALKNIQISPRGVSLLGSKFIVYLTIAHNLCANDITEAMHLKGGYILHLDATCEGGDPVLMSSLDSISQNT